MIEAGEEEGGGVLVGDGGGRQLVGDRDLLRQRPVVRIIPHSVQIPLSFQIPYNVLTSGPNPISAGF